MMPQDTSRITHFDGQPTAPSVTSIGHAKSNGLATPVPVQGEPSTAAPVAPFDPNKDLTFPPVRQPTLQVRRYTRRIGSGQERPRSFCDVSPRVFKLIWCSFLLVHIICSIFLGFVGTMYFFLLGTALMGYLTLYGIAVDAFYLPPIGVAYFGICGLHAYAVATIIFHSLSSQRSVFTSTQFPNRTVTTPAMRIRRMSQTAFSSIECRTSSMLGRLPSPFVRKCFLIWNGIRKLYKATDVHNECYDSAYISRLFLVTLCHFFQLYLGSLYLPHRGMKAVWVGLVVINSVAAPIMTAMFRSNPPRTRLLCIALNLITDVAVLVVIPALLFNPYYNQYDPDSSNFSSTKWYHEMWFATALNELHLLLVSSLADFISKLGIAWDVSRGLRIIPLLLNKVDPSETTDVAQGEADLAHPTTHPNPTAVHPALLSPLNSEHSQSSYQQLVVIIRKGGKSVEGVGSILTVLSGVSMLALYLYATKHSIPSQAVHFSSSSAAM